MEWLELLRSGKGFPVAMRLGAQGSKDRMSSKDKVRGPRDHQRSSARQSCRLKGKVGNSAKNEMEGAFYMVPVMPMSGKNRLGHYDCLNTWRKSIRVKGTGIQGLGTHCTWFQALTPSYSWNSSPHGPGIPGDPFLMVIPKPCISLLYPSACSASPLCI